MNFRLISLLLSFLFSLPVMASGNDKWPSVADTYEAAACEAVASPSSACNQGSEPFSKFIAQFNVSLKFRVTRMKCAESVQDFLLTPWWKTGKPYKFIPVSPTKKNNFYLMTWTNVEPDSVWMSAGYVPPYEDDDTGISAVFHFKRINGKWFLVEGAVS